MGSDEVSVISLGYQQTEAALRREEVRAREVQAILRAQELRHVSEFKTFGEIKEQLSKAANQPGEFGFQLKLTADLSKTLKAQKARVDAAAQEVGQSKVKQASVIKSKKQVEDKLERLGEMMAAKKRQKLAAAEALEHEEGLEIKAAKGVLSKVSSINPESKHEGLRSKSAISAQDYYSGLEKEELTKSETRSDEGELVQSAQTGCDGVCDGVWDGVIEQCQNVVSPPDSSSLGSAAHFGGSNQRHEQRGTALSEDDRQSASASSSAPARQFEALMVKSPSEYGSQIAGLESWQGISGSGVSFSFETQNGAKLKLELVGNSRNDLSISISPESELDRRSLWRERGRISEALKSAGLSVKQILIKPYERS